MNRSAIAWTDYTSNPIYALLKSTGKAGWFCVKASKGCDHCYSEGLNLRRGFGLTYARENLDQIEFVLRPKEFREWKKAKTGEKIFIADMTDLFLSFIPFELREQTCDAMLDTPDPIFQLLTKRPDLQKIYAQKGRIPPTAWVGTSIEDRDALWRIKALKETPIKAKFISFEPLLGPIGPIDLTGISWIIVGGESGDYFRPMHIEWATDLITQAKAQNVAVFFKQIGGRRPGTDLDQLPEGFRFHEFPMVRT